MPIILSEAYDGLRYTRMLCLPCTTSYHHQLPLWSYKDIQHLDNRGPTMLRVYRTDLAPMKSGNHNLSAKCHSEVDRVVVISPIVKNFP